MEESDIKVRESGVPSQVAMNIRITLFWLNGLAVGKGWFPNEVGAAVIGIVWFGAPWLWANWRELFTHKKLVTLVAASDKASFK